MQSPASQRGKPSGGLFFAARRQRHHRIRATGVADEMLVVFVERASEPATALSLMALEPRNAASDGRFLGGHSGSAQNEDGEARAVAVARFEVLFFAVGTAPRIEP